MIVAFLDTVHPILWDRLTDEGHGCEDATKYSLGDILEGKLKHVHGVVVRARILLTPAVLDALPHLRFIARSGSGLENIDLQAAQQRGIQVFNSPEGNSNAVGEHALGLLLGLLRHIPRADRSIRSGQWLREAHRGTELSSLTVGIIGLGHTGGAFARKLQSIGCTVLAYDKYRAHYDGEWGVKAVPLEDLFLEADVISLHLPLNAETRGWVQDDWFKQWVKGGWFLHTARGPIASTDAIFRALQSGHLKGAALDVLDMEEATLEGLQPHWHNHPIFEDPRVICTPHIAGWTYESYFALSDVLADKILKAFPRDAKLGRSQIL
jgi:D-3-phosphoglycerate dehydrogenase